MYCEYWNLKKAPFDNVPDPSMYVDCHVSMENVISETIFAIKEGNECFAVIIGDVGLGKTLSLRIIIDSLETDKYRIALITNPSLSFTHLLREIIGQITGKQCEEKRKINLLEIFNRLLFTISDQGQKIVIFIDEANAMSPANLENLRLLTNMQEDTRNLFTLILAGQIELAQRLEHPKRANLFQRIGTYGCIDKLPSAEAVRTYIETRLKLSGADRNIFADDAFRIIYEYSDCGTPRLINKICKLCLKAGETNELKSISGAVAEQIAERFEKLSKTALQMRKPRNRPESEITEDEFALGTEEIREKTDDDAEVLIAEKDSLIDEEVLPPAITEPPPLTEITPPTIKTEVLSVTGETTPTIKKEVDSVTRQLTEDEQSEKKEIPPAAPREIVADIPAASPPPVAEIVRETPVHNESRDEILIRGYSIQINIPAQVLEQAKSADIIGRNKLAGYWAAQTIKENPQLTDSPLIDPVAVWHDIKDIVLKKIVNNTNNSSMAVPL
ncbi:MAG TPA: AAA family ATPase [Smithellaceae bacterium]|nr:AAA family ATPase [Smithellaceae bacterium]